MSRPLLRKIMGVWWCYALVPKGGELIGDWGGTPREAYDRLVERARWKARIYREESEPV